MKRKEFNDLRSKKIDELRKMAMDKKLESEKIRMKMYGGKEKNLKVRKNLSREVAKILTLIREKEIIESLTPVEIKAEEKKVEAKK